MLTLTRPKADPMPDETPESWRDWLPNRPATLSGAALIAQAQERGIDIDLRTLRSWQTQKVLPHPIRTGVSAVYPVEAIDFIARVRSEQGRGLRLEEIGPRLRAQAKGVSDRKVQNEFKRALTEATRLHEQLTGIPVKEMTATFTDNDGLESTYTVEKPARHRAGS